MKNAFIVFLAVMSFGGLALAGESPVVIAGPAAGTLYVVLNQTKANVKTLDAMNVTCESSDDAGATFPNNAYCAFNIYNGTRHVIFSTSARQLIAELSVGAHVPAVHYSANVDTYSVQRISCTVTGTNIDSSVCYIYP